MVWKWYSAHARVPGWMGGVGGRVAAGHGGALVWHAAGFANAWSEMAVSAPVGGAASREEAQVRCTRSKLGRRLSHREITRRDRVLNGNNAGLLATAPRT